MAPAASRASTDVRLGDVTVVACTECGFDGLSHPTVLKGSADRFGARVARLVGESDADALRARPMHGAWSAQEYVGHVGDAVRWYAGRIRRGLDEDRPVLQPLDWDAYTEGADYHETPVEDLVRRTGNACAELGDVVAALEPAQLIRECVGSDGTPRTIEMLLVRAHHELVHHCLDIRRRLGEPG